MGPARTPQSNCIFLCYIFFLVFFLFFFLSSNHQAIPLPPLSIIKQTLSHETNIYKDRHPFHRFDIIYCYHHHQLIQHQADSLTPDRIPDQNIYLPHISDLDYRYNHHEHHVDTNFTPRLNPTDVRGPLRRRGLPPVSHQRLGSCSQSRPEQEAHHPLHGEIRDGCTPSEGGC